MYLSFGNPEYPAYVPVQQSYQMKTGYEDCLNMYY